MQFARKRPFTAKQSINRALRLWVFLSSARQEGFGGVRPGVNYNGKQPQSHNMSTTSCHTVTLGMLLREADVHEKNGKRQEATKIRGGRSSSKRAVEGRQLGLAQARSNPIPLTFLTPPAAELTTWTDME